MSPPDRLRRNPQNQHGQDPEIRAARDGEVAMKRPAVAKKPPLPATLCLLEAIDVGGAARSPRLSPLHRNEAGSAAFLGVPNRAQQHTLELSMKSSLISAAVLAVATLWAGTAGAAPIGNGATLAPGAEPLVSK